jgi:DNA-binding NarL/FixJ family response regulator
MSLKTRILLVDDHEIVCEGLRLLLQKQPDFVVVGQALDGASALKLAVDSTPDIVIMDIDLAGESGIQAALQILARVPAARVIYLSASTESQSFDEAIKAGACGYVLKGRAFSELEHAIRQVISGHRYLCPEVADFVLQGYQSSLDSPAAPEKPLLSEREVEVLKLTAEGLRVKEIAVRLNLSVKTVDTHRSHLLAKLKCASVAELTRYAIRAGVIAP